MAPLLMVVTGEGDSRAACWCRPETRCCSSPSSGAGPARNFGARNTMTLAFFAMTATLAGGRILRRALPLVAGGFLLAAPSSPLRSMRWARPPSCARCAPIERPQMSAVYRTYLDLSDLLPPLAYSVVLAFFGLGAVFATLGIFCASAARHLALSAEVDVRCRLRAARAPIGGSDAVRIPPASARRPCAGGVKAAWFISQTPHPPPAPACRRRRCCRDRLPGRHRLRREQPFGGHFVCSGPSGTSRTVRT